jgi:hypothetical protein
VGRRFRDLRLLRENWSQESFLYVGCAGRNATRAEVEAINTYVNDGIRIFWTKCMTRSSQLILKRFYNLNGAQVSMHGLVIYTHRYL